ncbi:MAG: DUF2442 domain-containing protein [Leptolyngbyaceae cyanobacterium RU_5_1]|nr:DUF2442 domain-containing protein [Leptolyngbyaceae cyanobacterium RU_5_1]
MKCPRICKAKAIDNHTLMIEFTNQEIKKYDVLHLLENPMFAPLCQPAFFKNLKVEPGGYGIVWNEDIDLSEYELWKNGITVAECDRSVML